MVQPTMATTKSTKLELSNISVAFNGVPALQDVSLELSPGDILGLIGPNGAGKTTLINVASGYCREHEGSVSLGEKDFSRAGPERLAGAGIARTFQGVRLFGELTVAENVEVAALAAGGWKRRRSARAQARQLLEEFKLTEQADVLASSLPYGDERRLALARSLASEPAFLLLDEPAAGLNERETDDLAATMRELPGRYECGLLVVEHDMRLILELSHRIQVLAHGKTIAAATPDKIRTDPAVIEAYLGRQGAKRAVA